MIKTKQIEGIFKRAVIEITTANLVDLEEGNGGKGILCLNAIPGKVIEIVGTPLIYRNSTAFYSAALAMSDNLTLYHEDQGQIFEMDIKEGFADEVDNLFMATDFINQAGQFLRSIAATLPIPVGESPEGEGYTPGGPGSVYLKAEWTTDVPTEFNLGAKAWICFDYFIRETPE